MPKRPTGGIKGKSRYNVPIAFRISRKDAAKLDKRVGEYPGEMSRGDYARMRFIYDLNRKHISHGPKKRC